jgi:hypothetical protein
VFDLTMFAMTSATKNANDPLIHRLRKGSVLNKTRWTQYAMNVEKIANSLILKIFNVFMLVMKTCWQHVGVRVDKQKEHVGCPPVDRRYGGAMASVTW